MRGALVWCRGLWGRIAEPRRLKAVYFVAYLVTVFVGVAALLDPPNTVQGKLGGALTVVWGAFLLLCGFLGAASVFPGWWGTERLAIAAGYVGLGIYAAVVLTLHLTEPGARLTQLGVIVLASFVLTVRLVLIRGSDYEPRG